MPLMQVPYRRRLAVRLTAAIATVVALTFAVFVLLALGAQKTRLEAEAVRGAALLSDTIRASGLEHMLDDRGTTYALMDTIANGRASRRSASSTRGRITFSPSGPRSAAWSTSGPNPATPATQQASLLSASLCLRAAASTLLPAATGCWPWSPLSTTSPAAPRPPVTPILPTSRCWVWWTSASPWQTSTTAWPA